MILKHSKSKNFDSKLLTKKLPKREYYCEQL